MISIPTNTIQYILMPLISAQLLSMVLVYFIFVRRHILVNVKLYVCFLVTFILFLLGKVLQGFADYPTAFSLLYARVSLLFTLGIPSMFIASAVQSGFTLSRIMYVIPYLFGGIVSIIYVVTYDALEVNLFMSQQSIQWLPLGLVELLYQQSLIVGVTLLVIVPCFYLLYKEYNENKNPPALAFLFGSLAFALFFVFGTLITNSFWLYYIGSIVTASCWVWAVYHDIKHMKGESLLLKEELYFLLRTSNKNMQPKLEEHLRYLENQSLGNLEHYKLKVREILNLLTETNISSGGNTNELLARNAEKTQAIKQGKTPDIIRKIATDEVIELTQLLADIPVKRSHTLVKKTQCHIEKNYQQHIDITELAKQVNVSESYLMRLFKKEVGQTINQYITAYRIEQAKPLLEKNSVTDTAFAVGFNNSNYFSTVFKKLTGLNPLQYQQSQFK